MPDSSSGLVGKRYPGGDEIRYDNVNCRGTGGKDKWSKCVPVGSFEANDYGLYDMVGNVWEWCADWYSGDYYGKSPATNRPGLEIGSYRVLRGRVWDNSTSYLWMASRNGNDPGIRGVRHGFRCVSGFVSPQSISTVLPCWK